MEAEHGQASGWVVFLVEEVVSMSQGHAGAQGAMQEVPQAKEAVAC